MYLPHTKNKQTLYLPAAFVCIAITFAFMLFSEQHRHWFMIPVTFCAFLLIPDFINWLTGKYNLFDPLGLTALMGLFFFFLNPILHVHFDTWMLYIVPPSDWRPWLGFMGILNVIGLLIYRFITSHFNKSGRVKTYWKIDYNKSYLIILAALAVTLCLQLYIFARFGGIQGYVQAYSARTGAFAGMGWLFMISESFSVLLMIFIAILAMRHRRIRSWLAVIIGFLIFLSTAILFGGLRGSRSNLIWQCFWFAGIIHLMVRPLKKSLIVFALIFLFIFMYIYGAYKHYGLDALAWMTDTNQMEKMMEKAGKTPERTLLNEMGRSDVQAYVLYKLSGEDVSYRYKWGATYISGLTLFLPRFVRPQIPGKSEAGFELLRGGGERYGDERTSYVYGLAGEAMLNFGPAGIPFVFAVFAWLVSKWRSFMMKTETDDARVFMFPLIVNAFLIMLQGDFGLVVFFIIKFGFVPCLIIWSYSRILVLKQNIK